MISPYNNEAVNSLNAREVFNLIVKMAHNNGEPGIVFLDRLNEYNPTPEVVISMLLILVLQEPLWFLLRMD